MKERARVAASAVAAIFREGERRSQRGRGGVLSQQLAAAHRYAAPTTSDREYVRVSLSVCVCVCVCELKQEAEGEGVREGDEERRGKLTEPMNSRRCACVVRVEGGGGVGDGGAGRRRRR
jgi:hypothetical protein